MLRGIKYMEDVLQIPQSNPSVTEEIGIEGIADWLKKLFK